MVVSGNILASAHDGVEYLQPRGRISSPSFSSRILEHLKVLHLLVRVCFVGFKFYHLLVATCSIWRSIKGFKHYFLSSCIHNLYIQYTSSKQGIKSGGTLFLVQLVFCQKKPLWIICVEVPVRPSPKKNPGSAPEWVEATWCHWQIDSSLSLFSLFQFQAKDVWRPLV